MQINFATYLRELISKIDFFLVSDPSSCILSVVAIRCRNRINWSDSKLNLMTNTFIGFTFTTLLIFNSAYAQSTSSEIASLSDLSLWTQSAPDPDTQTNVLEAIFTQVFSPLNLGEQIELSPSFQSEQTSYSSKVPYNVTDVVILASTKTDGTSVKITGVKSNGESMEKSTVVGTNFEFGDITADIAKPLGALTVGENIITIDVTDDKSKNKQTYAVVMKRSAPDLENQETLVGFFADSIVEGISEDVANAIAHGVDIDEVIEVDREQLTPLLAAVMLQHDEVVRHLIEAGADVNLRAVSSSKVVPIGFSTLMASSQRGDFKISRMLIEAGANVNFKTETDDSQHPNGFTALMYAVLAGDGETVHLLIEEGADIDVTIPTQSTVSDYKDAVGATALILVLFQENPEYIARTLIEAGADVNAKIADSSNLLSSGLGGISALMIAVLKKNQSLVELTLEHGADVNYQIPGKREIGELNSETAGLTALQAAKNVEAEKIMEILEKAKN